MYRILPVDVKSSPRKASPGDRYEPLPGLADLPTWIWRRLPGPGKVALILLPFVVIGLILALGPGIRDSKEERARSEEQRIERERAAREARLREQQRPRFAAGAPAAESVAGRERLLETAAVSVRADARKRAAAGELTGPIRGVECEPFPRTTSGIGAEQDPSRRFGIYSCLAVTAQFSGSTGGGEVAPYTQSEAGTVGHPYRVRIDFESGRYAFCKIAGRAGEGGLSARQVVTVPRVCGGL
jgi:hypothetical protein